MNFWGARVTLVTLSAPLRCFGSLLRCCNCAGNFFVFFQDFSGSERNDDSPPYIPQKSEPDLLLTNTAAWESNPRFNGDLVQ